MPAAAPAWSPSSASRSPPASRASTEPSDVQLELVLADPHVVAGLEAGAVEGGDHAHLLQPLLQVGERLFVAGVVAFEEHLDAAAEDAEGAVLLALDPVAPLASGPVDPVLGLELARLGAGRNRGRSRGLGQIGEDPQAQLVKPLAGRRGDREDAERAVAEALGPGGELGLDLLGGQQVALAQPHQLGAVGLQLAAHRLVVGARVTLERGEVDEVDEHRAALNVGEELVAETGALRRPLDQAGDVGDHRLAVLTFDRPQRRRDRREGVVGDLRRRPGQAAEQRGLAGVRAADPAVIGEHSQLQLDPVRFPAAALLGEARRLAGGVSEALVAVPSTAAAGDDGALAGGDEVDQAAVDRARLRSWGDRDLPVIPPRAVAIGAFAVPSPLRPEMLAPLQGPQIAPRGAADQHHVATMTAIAPIGPAPRNVGLTPKAAASVTTGTALNPDYRVVIHELPTLNRAFRRLAGRGGCPSQDTQHRAIGEMCPERGTRPSPNTYSARTLIVRPLRDGLKATRPSRVAKIVWSRPMPTPSPGQKRVPRWRTMISPPLTCSPAKTLTPSMFGFDSRPLRLEPRPFLCAMPRPPLSRLFSLWLSCL